MATTHEQQRRILINVAYSLQYSLKDQIKPKHLASRFFVFFLLYYASKYFAYTFYFLKSLYISDFFRIFFLYVVLQNWLPCVAFERRWTILTTTYI